MTQIIFELDSHALHPVARARDGHNHILRAERQALEHIICNLRFLYSQMRISYHRMLQLGQRLTITYCSS